MSQINEFALVAKANAENERAISCPGTIVYLLTSIFNADKFYEILIASLEISGRWIHLVSYSRH